VTPDNRNSDPLDPILRRAMRARPGPATPECADAESLAAYSDRSLAATERDRLETHFADCMRCQLMLADIARAEESARIASAASEVPWYRRWRIAIPALAAVAAVLVFIAIRRPANEESQSDQLVAMAKNEAPYRESAKQTAPASPPQVAPPVPAPAAAASVLAMNEGRKAIVHREAQAMYRSAPAPAVAPAVPAAAPESLPAAPASAPAASASNVIAMNEAKTESAARGEAISAYSSQVQNRQATAPGARAFGALAAGVAVGTAARGSSAETSGATAATEVLMTGYVTWIIGRNGMVQRRDADGTMHIQHSGVSTDLIAASAPSVAVCWIVGRSGTIIRTTDGEHWELINAPSAENLAAVSASSARYATITTAGGQSFATSDGGASWHQQ
jgi:hypothetical protein